MALSAHEERTLESISGRLTGSDPELAALLASFTQLAAGEDMPAWERVRAGGRRAARRPGNRRSHHRRRARGYTGRVYRRLGFQRAALLLWLVITIVLITVALALSRSGSQAGCTATLMQACAPASPAHHPGSADP